MCGMERNMLVKDFHKLMKSIVSFSNKQAEVYHYEESLESFKVQIVPNDGLYCGGKFSFEVTPKNYPQTAPNVTCMTPIYHPNIDDNGEICLNLFNEWVETNNLEDCVQGLLFLLYNPNLEDPLSPLFDPEQDNDYDQFAQNVRQSLEGGVVEGVAFERNLVEELEDASTGINDESTSCQKEDEANKASQSDSTAGDVCELVGGIAETCAKVANSTTRTLEIESANTVIISGDTEANKNTATAILDEKLDETSAIINERDVVWTTEPNPARTDPAPDPELQTAKVTDSTETNELNAISNSNEKWNEAVIDVISGKVHPHRTEDIIVGCTLF